MGVFLSRLSKLAPPGDKTRIAWTFVEVALEEIAEPVTKTGWFWKKKAETSNGVVPFNEDSKQQMKMTPICFAKRSNEIKETAAFCLIKTRNQHVRSCKQKSVIKKDSCQFPIGWVLNRQISGVS